MTEDTHAAANASSTPNTTFYTVNAPTGSGKTWVASAYAVSRQPANFCFVMPTKQLIDDTVADLRKRFPAAEVRIKACYSKPFGPSVVSEITEFLKATPADRGILLFITHEAFLILPYWHLRSGWNLIVDEVIGVTYSEQFTLHENRLWRDNLDEKMRQSG